MRKCILTHENVKKLDVLYIPQPAIACSKLTIKTLGQGVKFVQS